MWVGQSCPTRLFSEMATRQIQTRVGDRRPRCPTYAAGKFCLVIPRLLFLEQRQQSLVQAFYGSE